MSLKAVVLDVANNMISCKKPTKANVAVWAAMLKGAALASAEGAGPAAASVPAMTLTPGIQHFQEVEKARAEFRNKAKAEEMIETKMLPCEDGPDEGIFIPVDPRAPAGARMRVPGSGTVYELGEDGKLRHKPILEA